MKSKLITVYESTSTDGYRNDGDGRYFSSSAAAVNAAKTRHGAHGSGPRSYPAIELDGEVYLLQGKYPIDLDFVKGTRREIIKVRALAKLNDEEKEVLGL